MSLPDRVESSPTPPVSSLRSRFEQLAVVTSSPKWPNGNGFLLPGPVSPRPRAASGPSDQQPENVRGDNHLRTSSSSSDLKGTKRPPPPPPRALTPTAPTHLRPSHTHYSSSLSHIATYGSTPNLLDTTPYKKPPPPPPPAKVIRPSEETPFFDTTDAESDAETAVMDNPPPLPSRRASVMHDRQYSLDSNSSTSSKSDTVGVPRIVAPPRPPPRSKTSMSPSNRSSLAVLPQIQAPPPLPARRNTSAPLDELSPLRRTPRKQTWLDPESLSSPSSPSSTPTTAERKTFGILPPPPKRTIAIGDTLPELKQKYASDSSSSDEEEEEAKVKYELPDTSRSSRRPPLTAMHSFAESHIHVPAHTGIYTVAGHIVVVAVAHGIKVFDLSVSEHATWSIDTKDITPDRRSRKVTSLEFRLPKNEHDHGCLVWIGTKEGHIFEMDVRTATLTSAKMSAHANPITYIWRHGHSMVTMDDYGKVLIFDSDDIVLSKTVPKVMRVADKQYFVKLIAGYLWMSAREPHPGSGSISRGPAVRVYDISSPGTNARSMLPTEHVGTVTCATTLATTPGIVYLGHEGGNVTVWSYTATDGGFECVESIKVSMTDVLCLAGVNERLWSGGRSGQISAYDITVRPWVVTNCWMAHNALPLSAINVDPWSIGKIGKLSVVSVGRDERLRFWDGLLAIDWVEHELMKRQESYSTYRELSVLIVSWNIDANKPEALHGDAENINFLHNVLTSAGVPDIISFGFQEVVDLESRRTAAKSVLLGSKTKTNDGLISQKVSSAYRKWNEQLILSVRLAMPPDVPYTVVHSESLVGLYTCIFVKNSERISMKEPYVNTIKRGMGGNFGNKGAIIGRFVIDDTSICFINCHLAAGQHQTRQRGRDVAGILEEKALFPENAIMEPVAFTNGGDGSMVLDHEIVFFSGDMNYRIEQRREAAIAFIRSGDHEGMHAHDQLLKEMKFNRGFRLRSFMEGTIHFIPTYKYDRRTNDFDTSPKKRIPAWCDRILWRAPHQSRVRQTQYRRWEANISDHRPISGAFELTVKSIKHEARAGVKREVEAVWKGHERTLLMTARQFYVEQFLL